MKVFSVGLSHISPKCSNSILNDTGCEKNSQINTVSINSDNDQKSADKSPIITYANLPLHFKALQQNIVESKIISAEEYEKLIEEIKTEYSNPTEYFTGSKLYSTDGYQKSIEKKYEGLIPYIGEHDFSADINRYLSKRELFVLSDVQAEKLTKVLDYSLAKMDEEYGKYNGIVYRKGFFNPNIKQFYSTSIDPKSAAKLGGSERYLPYAGYSIIKTKSGHKIYDFQNSHGSHFGNSEKEVLLPRNLNYREITSEKLAPEDIKLKEEFASKFFNGAEDVVYNGKFDCGENRDSILKRIKVYEECADITQ